MRIASKSDIGMVRSTNQDSFSAGELFGSAWAVVCDGMGGANGGNIASGISVKTISDCITNAFHENMKNNCITAMLESAITAANLNVFDEAADNPTLSGMGTTVVAAVVNGDSVIVAHAGDSRAYSFIDGKLTQLTKDHSIVQKMLEKGELSPSEAARDPRKNVITRALGVNEEIEIDFCEIDFPKNSVILLCTDGLTNYVDENGISDIIVSNVFEDCPDMLVEAANKFGGSDNITVVMIKNN